MFCNPYLYRGKDRLKTRQGKALSCMTLFINFLSYPFSKTRCSTLRYEIRETCDLDVKQQTSEEKKEIGGKKKRNRIDNSWAIVGKALLS